MKRLALFFSLLALVAAGFGCASARHAQAGRTAPVAASATECTRPALVSNQPGWTLVLPGDNL
jgi:hypothetical protein